MTIIQEFSAQLRRNTSGALWHKIDLHNHSPASHDFQGNRATALDDFAAELRDRRLSVVMFTDHEVLPDARFIKELSERTGTLVLAGLEVNVFVNAFGKPAEKVGKELCFHLLVGFDPEGANSPAYWCEHLYRQCRKEQRSFGTTKMTGIASDIDEIANALKGSGAFIIPAHLHSGPDAFKSRSIDKIFDDAEFLRWASAYFTALDVRNDKTASFFDGKHSETGKLEISCIRSSDAHRAVDVGTFPTWAQMESVSFSELKAALELPSRISRIEPTPPASHIVGLHVDGVFLRDFWLALSPHSNVLIGVKGSGKTSVLECLRFALGTDVPRERAEEVNKHLSAILGPAGRVRVLVRRDDGALVLIERRSADRKFRVSFDDDREIVLPSPDGLRFSAAVLGWHEIEHAATDRQIRRLHMDAIAGRDEVRRLTADAELHALSIRRKHDSATVLYNEYLLLAEAVRQQEALRAGLQQLQDANLIELRDQMSNALADREEIARLTKHLEALPAQIGERIPGVLQINQFSFNEISPLAELTQRVREDIKKLSQSADSFCESAISLVQSKAASAAEILALASTEFDKFSSDYRAKLERFPPEVQRLLESHREVLEKTRELPNLKARLEGVRDQIDIALSQLSETCENVASALDVRLKLRARKISEFNQLLKDAGVILAVIPGAAQEDEFAATFNQYKPTREVFQHLRQHHSNADRFHRTLAQSYDELRRDLMSGDKLVFARAEFGHLITVLENDDLEIKFAVEKPGEPFSPIDQLSAGQRCTAVFPIILKLKDGPLVVDQPEDNLDNRHIARSVAPILVEDKRTRQIIMTSHNANLVVLSDPEYIAVFEAEHGTGKIFASGFLAHRKSTVTAHVLDILDGGERALELRSKKYGRDAQFP